MTINNRKLHTSLLAASVLVLAGCSLAPTYQRPDAPIPQQWRMAGEAVVATGQPQPSAAATLDWQSFVQDAQLRKLVELAIANNRDLRQTLLNVQAARAQYRARLNTLRTELGG